jgi:hypothetical protein
MIIPLESRAIAHVRAANTPHAPLLVSTSAMRQRRHSATPSTIYWRELASRSRTVTIFM